jgi:hypothetical protein
MLRAFRAAARTVNRSIIGETSIDNQHAAHVTLARVAVSRRDRVRHRQMAHALATAWGL